MSELFPLPPPSVLVVDDERAIRRLVYQLLGQAGYRVFEAADGLEALSVLGRAGRVDLLLVDVVMPSLDGRSLARDLRSRYPAQRLLLMSARTPQELARSRLAGLQQSDLPLPFLQKPFTGAELLAKVGEVMGQTPAPTG